MPMPIEFLMHLQGQRLRQLCLSNEARLHSNLPKTRTVFLGDSLLHVIGHYLVASIKSSWGILIAAAGFAKEIKE